MQPMILKSYEGTDPKDGEPIFLMGLHDAETNELKACLGLYASEESRPLLTNLELFKLGNMLGAYKMGEPTQAAFDFLVMPTTVLIAQLDVHAEQHTEH